MQTSGHSPRLLLLMRRRSRTSRYSGQSPSSIGRRNNCFHDHPADFTSCWTAPDLRKGGRGKEGYDHLETIKILASRRSSCWSLCHDRVCRLERLNLREVFPNHFFYWFSLISPIRPYGYRGRVRALLSKPSMGDVPSRVRFQYLPPISGQLLF